MDSKRWGASKKARQAKHLQFEALEQRVVMSASSIVPIEPVAPPETVQAPAVVANTVEDWVHSLNYLEFGQLTALEAIFLTPTQISSIPNTGWFNTMSAAARGVLNASQVQGLDTSRVRITPLTTQQITWLTVAQQRELSNLDFYLLSPSQIPNLTPEQAGTINSTSQLNGIPVASRAAFTEPQIQAITFGTTRIYPLTATQRGWLTTTQIRSLTNIDFTYLTPTQIPSLTNAQVASINSVTLFGTLSDAAQAALTKPQVRSLNIAAVRINQLTPTQVSWLTTGQIQAVSHMDFALLSAVQTPYLTTAQIASISSWMSFDDWSAAARAALSATQVRALVGSAVELTLLTPAQISALRTSQIQVINQDEFALLSPSQIPLLTPAQVGTIPNTGWFNNLPAAIRTAFTLPQIQALNANAIRISSLTPQQRDWLTIQQIRSVLSIDFSYLIAAQIPFLTSKQIAQINGPTVLAQMSDEARAALTPAQVRMLNVGVVFLSRLTHEQVGWLRSSQIRTVQPFDFLYLHPSQIPQLSTAQFAAITDGYVLSVMPEASRAALTREQIFALPNSEWVTFAGGLGTNPNYHPAEHMPVGPDGISTADHIVAEAAKFLAIVPINQATHWTVASGNWSNPAIWRNGIIPSAGAKVHVAAGHTVQFDVEMTSDVNWLRIDGKLNFATNRNTALKADTVVVATTGILHIGTEANPIQDNYTARIIIAANGPINTVLDPSSFGRGVISRGEVRMYGKAVTPYASLAVAPAAGDTTLTLTSVPQNWRVGDRIVIAGTVATRPDFGADEVTILAINGSTITVEPLQYFHSMPEGYGLTLQVANLTRNVIFESENEVPVSQRPHMVFIHNPNIEIENIGVYGFGRTDKSFRINDPVVVNNVLQPGTGLNNRARYAIHFHHTGVNPAYESVKISGSLVVDSPGWGFVNHSSNVDFTNNVAYNVYGASFAAEDGNEIGSMTGNLSISSRGSEDELTSRKDIHDFGFKGHGFWLQGPGVKMVDNISAGSLGAGFSYFTTSTKTKFDAINLDDPSLAGGQEAVPVDGIPLALFDGNTAYAAKSGVEVWHSQRNMTGDYSVIDNFTSWNTRMAGVEAHYSAWIEVRNATLIGNLTDFTGNGVTTNKFVHDMRFTNVTAVGWLVGIDAPVRRSTVINGGYFAAVQGVYVDKGYDEIRSITVTGATFSTLTPAQLQGRVQYDLYAAGSYDVNDFFGDRVSILFDADDILFAPVGLPAVKVYFGSQLRTAVPFPSSQFSGLVPSEYLNKTNAQLTTEFGVAFNGESLDPATVLSMSRIYGYARYNL